jgi:hypothetical protein
MTRTVQSTKTPGKKDDASNPLPGEGPGDSPKSDVETSRSGTRNVSVEVVNDTAERDIESNASVVLEENVETDAVASRGSVEKLSDNGGDVERP